jgi:hypothetical protein
MLQGRKNYIQNTKKTNKPGTERITTRNRTHPKGSKTEKEKGDTALRHSSSRHSHILIFYFNF